jgi:hypothetical protein
MLKRIEKFTALGKRAANVAASVELDKMIEIRRKHQQ